MKNNQKISMTSLHVENMQTIKPSQLDVSGQSITKYPPVWVSLGVQRTHVIDFLQVNVGEDQLVVTGIYHSRTI